MGMSASQVRFLSLQSRKHSIGNQLTKLSNRKMALSRDMDAVAMKYTHALNQKLLKWSNDSGSNYSTLTYNLLMRPNDVNCEQPYIVTKATTGEVVLNNDKLTDIRGNQLNISYVDIAKMLSTYSGISEDDNTTLLFNNQNALVKDSDGKITGFNYAGTKSLLTDENGNVIGGKPSENNAYNINKLEPNYEGSLRCELLHTLGVYSDEDYMKLNNIFIKLYGGQRAYATGSYPVGSAMGDYYLAVSELESYKTFLHEEHPYSIGNTYGGMYAFDASNPSQNTSRYGDSDINGRYDNTMGMTAADSKNVTVEDTSFDADYKYEALVDGKYGQSTITQTTKTNKSGSLEFVDFTKHVTTDSHGMSTVVDGALSDYSAYTVSNSSSVGSSTIKVDGNGITAIHTTDSLLEEALANYTNAGGGDNWIDALSKSKNKITQTGCGNSKKGDLAYSEGTVIVSNTRGKSYYGQISQSALQSGLSGMCDSFKALVKNDIKSTSAFSTISDEVYAGAKYATVSYLINNCNKRDHIAGDDRWAWSEARARSLSTGYGLGACGAKVSGHSDYVSVSVDTGVAFNVYMSYLKAYANADPSVVPTNYNTITLPAYSLISEKDYSSISESAYESLVHSKATIYSGSGSNKLNITTYGTEDTNGHSIATAEIYDLSATQDANHQSAIWVSASGDYDTDGSATHDSTYTKYYYNPMDTSSVTYYTRSNSDPAISGSAIVCDDGTAVYGCGEDSTKQYKYTDRATLEKILRGEVSYTNGTVVNNSVTPGSGGGVLNTGDPYRVEISNNYKNSYYDPELNDKWNDNGILQKLQNNVDKCKTVVDNLKNEADEIGSSKMADYYDALFTRIAKNGWVVDDNTSENKATSTTYLNNKLQNNDYFITESKSKLETKGYNYTTKMAQNVTKIYEVYDDDACNTALAEYESEKKEIQSKEDRIDLVMQKLETEQEAINTTMESVQKIIKDNIQKTFRMFA